MKDKNGGANKLFYQNKKLVYYVYNRLTKDLPKDFLSQHGDDLKQEGFIALWKASMRYDESKGCAFSTYAISLIKGYMRIYIETIRRARRLFEQPQIISLDIVKDIPVIEEDDEIWLLTDNRLTENERKLLILISEGYNQAEIARKYGVSRQTINKKIKHIRNKINSDV